MDGNVGLMLRTFELSASRDKVSASESLCVVCVSLLSDMDGWNREPIRPAAMTEPLNGAG